MAIKWFKVALFNFLIAATFGALLRFAFVEELEWMQFRNWMHGHSHVAMLGWVYMGLYILIVREFLGARAFELSFFNWNLGLTQISVLGMLVTFPIFGYAGISIAFSSLHIVLSYFFVVKIWRKEGRTVTPPDQGMAWSRIFLRLALFFLVLSTFAIWLMVPTILSGNAGSAFYYGLVQCYLHFQFNGWFIFAILALLFKFIESKNIHLPDGLMRWFTILLVLSCFLTFTLAITWSTPLPWLFAANSIGVLIQLAALVYFILIIRPLWPDISSSMTMWVRTLLVIAFLSFCLKIFIQTAVVLPALATIAYTIRNYVIGFIHLMLLGMVSTFILGMAGQFRISNLNSGMSRVGLILILTGIILSEAVLFLQGTMFWAAMGFIPGYYLLLFIVSVLIPTGVLLILTGQFARPASRE